MMKTSFTEEDLYKLLQRVLLFNIAKFISIEA